MVGKNPPSQYKGPAVERGQSRFAVLMRELFAGVLGPVNATTAESRGKSFRERSHGKLLVRDSVSGKILYTFDIPRVSKDRLNVKTLENVAIDILN